MPRDLPRRTLATWSLGHFPRGIVCVHRVSVELFGWMTRNPAHPVAQVLSRPGFELQKRLSTPEPSEDQVEVADAARDACLALAHERQLS